MLEEASWRVQDEHDKMFPLRAGRSFIRDCPQLVAAETTEVGTVASTQAPAVPVRLVGVVQAEVAVQHLVEVAVGV